jgi:hypothetical protein
MYNVTTFEIRLAERKFARLPDERSSLSRADVNFRVGLKKDNESVAHTTIEEANITIDQHGFAFQGRNLPMKQAIPSTSQLI